MQTGFQLFGPEHLAVIALVPIVAGFLAVTRRRFPRTARPIRYGLALLLMVCNVSYYGNWVIRGERIFPGHMPLDVCDVGLWLMVAVLVTLKPAIFDVAYYWALVGAALAVVTPNLTNESLFLKAPVFRRTRLDRGGSVVPGVERAVAAASRVRGKVIAGPQHHGRACGRLRFCFQDELHVSTRQALGEDPPELVRSMAVVYSCVRRAGAGAVSAAVLAVLAEVGNGAGGGDRRAGGRSAGFPVSEGCGQLDGWEKMQARP